LSLLGLFAGQLASRLGLPRVVAYVLVGVLFSTDFLGRFFPINSTDWVRPLTDISLNVIAFIIGGSITLPQLQRMGKSMLGIAFFESLGAMLMVFLAVLLFIPPVSLALAFSAISSTTAPAGTIAVLHQYHGKGTFSSTLLGVVALDDAFGMIFFSIMMTFLVGGSLEQSLEMALMHILGAILLGCFAGFCLAKLLVLVGEKNLLLPLVFGFFARLFLYSAGDKLFGSIYFLEETVFLAFFTLAGTHFHFSVFTEHLDLILWYFFARILGKILGAALGGKLTKSPLLVTRWLGFALVPQAGVAIGLALTLSHQEQFSGIGLVVVNVILATTLIYELVGPLSARFALKKAGEIEIRKISR
jgi:Kef-type K+ transport system membrane component KefB